ncbi:di-heme-cytochrome C peroxidase [Aliikangiella sp. IMCC44359]|uniref:di-heme-cytochrome C peroxidase n=1 Tax=Aliikangiella sp. IMCC44359 TaxID=3459125 RepID=UPI00403ABA76
MNVKNRNWVLAFGLIGLLVSCSSQQQGVAIQSGQRVEGAIGHIIELEQGWTNDTQQSFYFTTQGSRILPYQWYLNLEQADNQTLFRDNANMRRLNYLPSEKSKWNPDGLAVGFVKDFDKKTKTAWMGFNCSACHTGQIRYENIEIRIDGGPTLADFETFNNTLVDAMSKTYKQDDKFTRFATAVLGSGSSNKQKDNLWEALKQQTNILAARNQVNHPTPEQPHYGYGRVDAIGAIFNQILSKFNDMPENGRASDAPVSYPFLWGTHQSDVVQWPGFAPNGPLSIGALIRNGGEVLGVYGQLHIPADKAKKHYKSSLAIENLGLLEQWVAELRSPQWPDAYLPPFDQVKVARGKQWYEQYCINCHQVIKREDEGKPYKAVLTPLDEVKTDPKELTNMLATRPAGKFEGRKELVLAGPVIAAETTGLEPLVNSVVGALLEHPIQTVVAAKEEFEGGGAADTLSDGIKTTGSKHQLKLTKLLHQFVELRKNIRQSKQTKTDENNQEHNPAVYKARPLNGIWATAPYLHNGSVPNLYELLLEESKRSKTFYVGSRYFDPEKVGFISEHTSNKQNSFLFDTSLIGNSNQGHNYGVLELNESQRLELLEYLKTL